MPTSTPLHWLPAVELARRIRSGELEAVTLVAHFIERIKNFDAAYNLGVRCLYVPTPAKFAAVNGEMVPAPSSEAAAAGGERGETGDGEGEGDGAATPAVEYGAIHEWYAAMGFGLYAIIKLAL